VFLKSDNAMLSFDVKGNLIPYKLIPSTLADMKKYLVDVIITSGTRTENYAKYRKYSNDLKKVLEVKELKQWIKGSFVTKKLNPKDIDFITFVDSSLVEKLEDKLVNFRPEKSWEVYGVDAYILIVYTEGSESYNRFTMSDIAYWHGQFTRTRRNRKGEKFPKGFLEIIC
jgi:hypothetical protein